MKILIIGNLGYVGPVLVEHLAAERSDWTLFGFDTGFFVGNETVKNALLPETHLRSQFFGDVRNFPFEILEGMDGVVYLAAISNDPIGNLFEKPTIDINQDCAAKIAVEAKARGVSNFVFASSCSVYGLADSAPRNEQSEVNPLTVYARSKVGGENLLNGIADPAFTVTCLRFATACGFSSRLRLDLVLNDFVASALSTGKIDILSDGTPWRPLIDVHDMAQAIEWALNRTVADPFLVLNAGSNEWNFQVVDLANAVRKILPDTSVSVNPNAQPDKRSYRVDFSEFQKLAGKFYPSRTLDQTIMELINGLKAIKFSDKNFRHSNLIRLNTLNALIANGNIDNQLIRRKSSLTTA